MPTLTLPDGCLLSFSDLQPTDVRPVTDGASGSPPLVLLHPFPFTHDFWRESAAAFAAAGHRVLCPDLPGFGASPLPAKNADIHTLAAMADELAAWLDALKLGRVVLGGLSMGGYVALAFAATHAERLAGLLLMDTRAAADSEAAKAGRNEAIAAVRAHGTAPLCEAMARKLPAASLDANTRTAIQARMAEAPEGIVNALLAMRERPDRRNLLPQITVPTLVLVGGEDAVTPPAEAREMAEAIPAAVLVELPGAGHLPPLETPPAFQAAVLRFLASHVAP